MEGASLGPLARGQTEAIRDEVFAEVNYHCPYEPMRSVRTARWKYIRRFHDHAAPLLANCDAGPTKDLWMQHGWGEKPCEREELYDLMFDPNEACNRSADPACAEALAEMRTRLENWMHRTDDPLLAGPIPLPDGAIVSEPTDITPQDVWKRIPQPKGYG